MTLDVSADELKTLVKALFGDQSGSGPQDAAKRSGGELRDLNARILELHALVRSMRAEDLSEHDRAELMRLIEALRALVDSDHLPHTH